MVKDEIYDVDIFLRKILIDFALDNKKEEMFKKLASANWKNEIVRDRLLDYDKLLSPHIPEFNFSLYQFLNQRSGRTDAQVRGDFKQFIEERKNGDDIEDVVGVINKLIQYQSLNMLNLTVDGFISELCRDLEILAKTKIVTNSQYRSVVYVISPNKIRLLNYKENVQEMSIFESLRYFKEHAETICITLVNPQLN